MLSQGTAHVHRNLLYKCKPSDVDILKRYFHHTHKITLNVIIAQFQEKAIGGHPLCWSPHHCMSLHLKQIVL